MIPRCAATVADLCDLRMLCRQVPECHKREGRDYLLPCLLAIMVGTTLAGVGREQRGLAAFADGLIRRQLRALGSYRKHDRTYDFPKETTFQRVLGQVDAEARECVLLQWEDRMLGNKSREADTVAVERSSSEIPAAEREPSQPVEWRPPRKSSFVVPRDQWWKSPAKCMNFPWLDTRGPMNPLVGVISSRATSMDQPPPFPCTAS